MVESNSFGSISIVKDQVSDIVRSYRDYGVLALRPFYDMDQHPMRGIMVTSCREREN